MVIFILFALFSIASSLGCLSNIEFIGAGAISFSFMAAALSSSLVDCK